LVKCLAHHIFEFADIGFDHALACRRAGVAFTLLIFDPQFVRGLLLERLQGAGQRADLVTALRVSGIDREIAGGHFQHGIAYVVERFDDAAADCRHGPESKRDRQSQQRELQRQRALGPAMLRQRVLSGRVERRFGDLDRAAHAPH